MRVLRTPDERLAGLPGLSCRLRHAGAADGPRPAAGHPGPVVRVVRIVPAGRGLPAGDIPLPEVRHRSKDTVIDAGHLLEEDAGAAFGRPVAAFVCST